jgi:hypothetical protein
MAYTIPARVGKKGRPIPEVVVDDEFKDLVNGMFVYLQGKSRYPASVIEGKGVLLHRLLWTLKYGSCPKMLDHVNGNIYDCRLENLRPASRSLNMQNRRRRSSTKLGLPMGVGIAREAKSRPYFAHIMVRGKRKHLGCFATPEEAHAVHTAMKFMLMLVESALCL